MHFLSLWILPLIHGEENTTWNDHSLLSIPRPLLSSSSRITHILFGSCNNEDKPQTIWPLLQDLKPHVWIFLGDNIYADEKTYQAFPPRVLFTPATPENMFQSYQNLVTNLNFSSFMANIPIIGTWDDHDYGVNDGDKTYPYRNESQQLFLDFIGESKDSLRREQQGVYTTHEYGMGKERVKIILLDTRYHKDPYGTEEGDFLGEVQWQWLQNVLQETTAAFNIIGSSIQVLPTDRPVAENWYRFPKQYKRLLTLLCTTSAKGVVLLSGDVHFAERSKIHCDALQNSDRKILEFTSSGLTHSWLNLPYVLAVGFQWTNYILPFVYRPDDSPSHYGGMNFGQLEFDWDNTPPKMTIRVLNHENSIVIEDSIFSTVQEPLEASQVHLLPIRTDLSMLEICGRFLIWILVLVAFIVAALLGIAYSPYMLFQYWRKKKLHQDKKNR